MDFTPGDSRSAYKYFHRQALELVGHRGAQIDLLVQGELGLARLTKDVASEGITDIEREEELVLYFQLKQLLEMLRAVSQDRFIMQPEQERLLLTAILYFTSPVDALPDDNVLGLFDDAQIVEEVYESLAADVDRFQHLE
ncbi:YkvA family protein [Exiguobacterium flavidum]|uniref:YkvA family protein n=1 Tax=Exiguobacterium flavidum TaxID=2184695 RepID=UPI000DF7CDCF|nr:YkvA family protein [Exiguobacterium flavidum]